MFAETDGHALYYETAGSDDSETITFLGEAGLGAWLWGWQQPRVAGPYETLVCDLRGAGRSDAPSGPYSVEGLAADVEAVLANAGVRRTHLVGAGLGGAVALRYAREYGRARSLMLFGTPPGGDHVERGALETLVAPEGSLSAGVSAAFLETVGPETIGAWRQADDPGPDATAAQIAALVGFDPGPLYELVCPALVCHGLDDPVVPAEAGRELAAGLPKASFEPVVGRHLAFVEHSRPVTDRLLGFLDTVTGETE